MKLIYTYHVYYKKMQLDFIYLVDMLLRLIFVVKLISTYNRKLITKFIGKLHGFIASYSYLKRRLITL